MFRRTFKGFYVPLSIVELRIGPSGVWCHHPTDGGSLSWTKTECFCIAKNNKMLLLRERTLMETHAYILFSRKSHKEKTCMSRGSTALKCIAKRPYPNPTQVNESTRLRRRENHVEGTRQTIPVPSEQGEPIQVTQKWGWRLFIKKLGLCKMATCCIGSDVCPVLEV